MASFDNKVVFITGSSSGLGRGAAIEFARQGATLALTGRNIERLVETAAMCTAVGLAEEKIYTVTGDLENDEELRRVFDAVLSHFGKLDVLVNNAGSGMLGDFESSSTESLDLMYRQHVRIPWELSRLAVPHLEKTKGSIVNMSSIFSTVSPKGAAAYGSMKAAMDHFSRIIAHELVSKGIRVNTVNPGAVRTPLLEDVAKTFCDGDVEKGCNMYANIYPIGRLGSIEEIARGVVYLASPNNGFLTGTNLKIDGGLTLSGTGGFRANNPAGLPPAH